jgi:DNA polymerase-3 subunit epsilon
LIPHKVCYFDLETGGLDPQKHGVVQIAMLVEVRGQVVGEKMWYVNPYSGDRIEPDALAVNKLSLEQVRSFPKAQAVLGQVKEFLAQYVDRYNTFDKFTPAGYNVQFDLNFLKQFFLKGGDSFFGAWFNYRMVDPMQFLYWLRLAGEIDLPNYKLETVCAHFDIPLGEAAHDALADIKATRDLIRHLHNLYLKGDDDSDGEQCQSQREGGRKEADGQPEGVVGEGQAGPGSGAPAASDTRSAD